jgi:hypothetical protein
MYNFELPSQFHLHVQFDLTLNWPTSMAGALEGSCKIKLSELYDQLRARNQEP